MTLYLFININWALFIYYRNMQWFASLINRERFIGNVFLLVVFDLLVVVENFQDVV